MFKYDKKKTWSFAKTTDILKKNWGQWSYLKITISTKSLMSIPFGGNIYKFGGKSKKKFNFSEFMDFVFSESDCAVQ